MQGGKFKGTNKEPYWDVIRRIVRESDLVLEVLDARLIELSRNEQVEEIIKEEGRPLIFVVNKSDLVSKKNLKGKLANLKSEGEVVFASSKERGFSRILLSSIKKNFKKHGKRELFSRGEFDPKPKYREAKADIVVGVLGYPNVGKSSIINKIAHRKKSKVSKKSGTTHGIHWVRATNEIKLIDSPGVIPLKKDDEIRYGLIGAKDLEQLKEIELVACAIIELFLKENKKSFEKFYELEFSSSDSEDILVELGTVKGHLMKAGKVDVSRTASMVINDWQQGRLKL